MSDRLEVVITGKNGVSRIFKEVTTDATRMGVGVEAASKKGSASFSQWMNVAQKAGAAFGAFSLVALRASGEAEASQARLVGAFENSGIAIDDYIESIKQAQDAGLKLAFDDEDVADSLAKLVGTTKDAGRAFSDLALAQDIARGANISLAAATDIVNAAETGRFRSMLQLGIKLDETATKEDYLAAAQAKYAGASERFAKTGAADFERWKNTAENALEAVGAHLTTIQGPLLALSASSTLIGTVGGALKGTAASAAISSVAFGPVGLAGAALAAGAGILYLTMRTDEYVSAANQAGLSTTNLTNFFTSLAATMDPIRAEVVLGFMKDIVATITDAATRQDDLNKLVALQEFVTPAGFSFEDIDMIEGHAEAVTGLTRAQLEWIDTNDDLVISIEEINAAVAMFQVNTDKLNAEQVKAVEADLESLFTRGNLKFTEATNDIEKWKAELDAGTITGEEFAAKVHNAAVNFSGYINLAGAATTATSNLTAAQKEFNRELVVGMQEGQKSMSDLLLGPTGMQSAERFARAHGESVGMLTKAFLALNPAETEAAVSTRDLTGAMDAQEQKASDLEAAIRGYADALGQTAPLGGSFAANMAGQATSAGAALSSAFRIGVGNLQGIGGQGDQIDKWARDLINVKGQYGKIDDLLARGVITTKDYNAAQAAGTSIFASNARLQDDMLEIQTRQAPIIADLADKQEAYWHSIADLPAAQQTLALAYADSEESAKGLAAAELLAAAKAGELGAAGEETATSMITAAVNADPYLAAMLEDMGLITVGADGTITIHWDDVKDAGASLDDVVKALTDLPEALAEVFKIAIDASDVTNANTEVANLLAQIGTLDTTSATVDVGVNYVTSGSPPSTNLNVGSGSIGGGTDTRAHGGIISAANGAVLVGEFGPELWHRTGGGGLVLPTGATRSHMGMGQAPVFQLIVQGNLIADDQHTEDLLKRFVPAMTLALQQWYDGNGIR